MLGHSCGLVEEFFPLVGREHLHHGLLQALEDTANGPDILPPSGFRAVILQRFVRLKRLEEYLWTFDHLVAGRSICLPVMIIEGLQLPGGQGVPVEFCRELCRRRRVGARQRCQDSAGGPSRDSARLNLAQHLLGQGLKKIEMAFHPGLVSADPPADLAKRLVKPAVQFLDKSGHLDRFQRSIAAADQQLEDRLFLARIQPLHHRRIPAQSQQGRKALIAVDQYQPTVLGRYDEQRLQLAVVGNRLHQRPDPLRGFDADMAVAQFQAMYLDL